MFAVTLSASLLGNVLTGKGKIGGGDGVIQEGKRRNIVV